MIDLLNSYNFSIVNGHTQMVNFPTRIPDCDSHSPVFLDFFHLTLVLNLQWLSLHWEILIMLLSIDFPTNSKQDAPFHCIAHDYFVLIGLVFFII